MAQEMMTAISVGDIVSRGWRLYRLNFKSLILYTLIPALLFTISGILFNIPSSKLVSSSGMGTQITVIGASFIIGCVVWLVACCVSVILNIGMAKNIQDILLNQPTTVTENIKNVLKKTAELLSLSVFLILEVISFYIIDIIFVMIGYFFILLPIFLLTALVPSGSSNLHQIIYGGIIAIIIFIAVVSVVLILLSLASIQFMTCGVQIVSVAITERDINDHTRTSMKIRHTVADIFQGFERTFKHFFKSILCGWLIWLAYYVISITIMAPVTVYMVMVSDVGLGGRAIEGYPMHAIILLNVTSGLVGAVLWPFIISSLVLFYYDIRIQDDGLDINDTLNELSGGKIAGH